MQNARQILERHWDTFITEDDFRWLSEIGINTVRIPIGGFFFFHSGDPSTHIHQDTGVSAINSFGVQTLTDSEKFMVDNGQESEELFIGLLSITLVYSSIFTVHQDPQTVNTFPVPQVTESVYS